MVSQRTFLCPWSLLPLQALMMLKVLVNIHGPCYHWRSGGHPWFVHDWKWCSCLWLVLLSRPMMVSMFAGARDHTEICSMCWAVWNSMIHAADDYKRQGSFFFSGMIACRLTVENERYRRILWQPLLPIAIYPERNSQDRKLLKTTLNMCDWDAELKHSKVDHFCWGGGLEKNSVFSKAEATGSFTVIHWVYGQPKLDLVIFFSSLFFKGRSQALRVDLEGRLGSEYDQGALYEIPK